MPSQPCGPILTRNLRESVFCFLAGEPIHRGRQLVEELADLLDVLAADRAGALARRGVLQCRRQRLPAQRGARPEVFGLMDAPGRLAAVNAQAVGQRVRQRTAQLLRSGGGGELVDQLMAQRRQDPLHCFDAVQLVDPLPGGPQLGGLTTVLGHRIPGGRGPLERHRSHTRKVSITTDVKAQQLLGGTRFHGSYPQPRFIHSCEETED
jgi:hypothetical protein